VILPASDSLLRLRKSDVDDATDNPTDADSDKLSRGDAKLLAQLLKKKSTGSGDDGPPLVTSAIRELDKARKAVVYNRCIIRIRLE
jgi:hypothetical protein